MVSGKPATNSLLLTSQQTGTVQPQGSVHVSFSFVATSVGRWTHELAVRNLSNKHDQASGLDFRIFACGDGGGGVQLFRKRDRRVLTTTKEDDGDDDNTKDPF